MTVLSVSPLAGRPGFYKFVHAYLDRPSGSLDCRPSLGVVGTERQGEQTEEVPPLIEETETRTQMRGHVGAVVGNVPVQLTRLVGREAALGELRSLVWRTRVLTLCGPGGAGKTRLAMALAEAMRPDFIRRRVVDRPLDDARVRTRAAGRRRDGAQPRPDRQSGSRGRRPPVSRVDAARLRQLRAGGRRMR